ncbi:MAG: hypothetical protein MJ105_00840 [Lachnospiraceae bacterium]|nr:hypothetical protein [Lachnospiraceae bacterium]
MKKRVLASVLAAVLCVSALAACSKAAWDGETETSDSKEIEQEVKEPVVEDEAVVEPIEGEREEEETKVRGELDAIPENTGETIYVDFGETICASNCDLTILSYKFYNDEEYTIKPSKFTEEEEKEVQEEGDEWPHEENDGGVHLQPIYISTDSMFWDEHKGSEEYMLDIFFSVTFKGEPTELLSDGTKYYKLNNCFYEEGVVYQDKYKFFANHDYYSSDIYKPIRVETDDHSDFLIHEEDVNKVGNTYYYHWLLELPTKVDKNNGSLVAHFEEVDNGQEYAIVLFDNGKAIDEERGEISEPGTVAKGQKYITEFFDFSIEKSQIEKEIWATKDTSKTSGHYSAKDGMTCVDVVFLIDSYFKSNTNALDKINAVVKVGGKEYEVNIYKENNARTSINYGHSDLLVPLDTRMYHLLAEVPESTKWSEDRVTLEFEIDGNKYTYYVRW